MDNYGTHYVRSVYYGGLAALSTVMSSANYASLSQDRVSASIGAQVAVVSVRAHTRCPALPCSALLATCPGRAPVPATSPRRPLLLAASAAA